MRPRTTGASTVKLPAFGVSQVNVTFTAPPGQQLTQPQGALVGVGDELIDDRPLQE